MQNGQSFTAALTTDIDAGKIVAGAVVGAVVGGTLGAATPALTTYGTVAVAQVQTTAVAAAAAHPTAAAVVGGVAETAVECSMTGGGCGIVDYAAGALTAGAAHRLSTPRGRQAGITVDSRTGEEIGRFIVDPNGNAMIEPKGGSTVPAGRGGIDTHTTYSNGSNYHRLNPFGHPNNPTPHAHGHLLGPGPNPDIKGQGPSIDVLGKVVPWNSADAHWPIRH